MSNTVFIASDHAGLDMKAALAPYLIELGLTAEDLGTNSAQSCDYPDFAAALAKRVKDTGGRGILICGSGIGMSIAANRVKGVRAALCRTGLEAELSRRHNDANVLCLGARLTGVDAAKECVKRFLETPFDGGRHQARVEKMG